MLDLKRIKNARIKADLTAEDVATALGYDSPNTIYNKEKGERKFTADEVVKLARLYDVSLDYLYGQVEETDAHRITLSLEELHILRLYRKLAAHEQEMIRTVMSTFIKGVGDDVDTI